VSLTDRYRNKDILSQLFDKHFLPWYDRAIGSRIKDPISIVDPWLEGPQQHHQIHLYNYPDGTVALVVNIISTVIAPLLPTVAIFALSFVHAPLVRLGMIMLFTIIFSLTVTLLTRARRVDCFTATAAFAAVLVVFVGNNGCVGGTQD
jgi:hypothetical protein